MTFYKIFLTYTVQCIVTSNVFDVIFIFTSIQYCRLLLYCTVGAEAVPKVFEASSTHDRD